jgi:hypothetical protein
MQHAVPDSCRFTLEAHFFHKRAAKGGSDETEEL